ncbi:MAG: glycosyltransferase, partial [Rhodospirillaceae bacterium]|nr:glycosyltransferase [Rhodospirillaceae bacterium]
MASPQITIITPCLNAEAFLSEALESVQNQDFKDIEHIVLDGGSTDGSLNILNTFPDLHILSKIDQGSHDAMNKGLELAKGDIIGFLNGDDTYEDGVFTDIAMHFAADPDLDMLCGGDIVFRQDGHGMRQVIDRRYRGESGLALSELLFGAPAFNARFYRRRLFEQIGNFDLTFDFSADRDFLIRAALAETRSISYEKPIYN